MTFSGSALAKAEEEAICYNLRYERERLQPQDERFLPELFNLMHEVEPHLLEAMPETEQDLATKEEMEEAAELTRLDARSEDLNEAHGRVKGNIAKV
eukprot:660943-Pelagomonas_calceolata.AAC.1